MKNNNNLPIYVEQRHQDDRTTYVGRGYVTYRSIQDKKEYIVYDKPKFQKRKQIVDEDELLYEKIANRY